MIHHVCLDALALDKPDAAHYACAVSSNGEYIIVQLGDSDGHQVRVALTRSQTEHLWWLLAQSVREQKNHRQQGGQR